MAVIQDAYSVDACIYAPTAPSNIDPFIIYGLWMALGDSYLDARGCSGPLWDWFQEESGVDQQPNNILLGFWHWIHH